MVILHLKPLVNKIFSLAGYGAKGGGLGRLSRLAWRQPPSAVHSSPSSAEGKVLRFGAARFHDLGDAANDVGMILRQIAALADVVFQVV